MSERAVKVTLTDAEVSHLLSLIDMNAQEGTYYGNREQYWRRSDRIRRKLDPAGVPEGTETP